MTEVEGLIRGAQLSSLGAEAGLAPPKRRRTTYANKRAPLQLTRRVRELSDRLARTVGYSPRHDALPPDFLRRSNRRQRDASLHRHAEKLALVDLLLRNKPELTLTINFHVCVDCHAFMRAASCGLGRTITVREPRMVHTFTPDGVCSCGGRWRWEARAEL